MVKGLVKAEWALDGRTVVCFSEWGVSLAVLFWASFRTFSVTYFNVVFDHGECYIHSISHSYRQRWGFFLAFGQAHS